MFKKPVTQVLVSVVVALLVSVLFVTGCVSPPAKQIIEDLAYIKIMASGYSDDADPEDDGIAIDIMYYDSKSQHIDFKNIPVEVGIELYGYGDVGDTFDHDKMELICTTQATIDHSMKLSEMFGEYIRIPFENIMVDPNKYYEFGTIKVTITTLEQGDFQDIKDLVRLYSED